MDKVEKEDGWRIYREFLRYFVAIFVAFLGRLEVANMERRLSIGTYRTNREYTYVRTQRLFSSVCKISTNN